MLWAIPPVSGSHSPNTGSLCPHPIRSSCLSQNGARFRDRPCLGAGTRSRPLGADVVSRARTPLIGIDADLGEAAEFCERDHDTIREMSRLISYILANRQSARKRVVIAVRFERDADIDLISVQDRDEQCVAIPCAAKTILILGGARALPTRPPANSLGEPPPRRLPHSSGRCSHYEPPDHLALCRSASSNVLDGYAAYKEAVCRQNSRETVCLPAALMVCRKVPRTSTA